MYCRYVVEFFERFYIPYILYFYSTDDWLYPRNKTPSEAFVYCTFSTARKETLSTTLRHYWISWTTPGNQNEQWMMNNEQ